MDNLTQSIPTCWPSYCRSHPILPSLFWNVRYDGKLLSPRFFSHNFVTFLRRLSVTPKLFEKRKHSIIRLLLLHRIFRRIARIAFQGYQFQDVIARASQDDAKSFGLINDMSRPMSVAFHAVDHSRNTISLANTDKVTASVCVIFRRIVRWIIFDRFLSY